MKDIHLTPKKFILVLILDFLFGLTIGVVGYHFLIPLIPNIKENINDESIYIVENKCEPVEEIVEEKEKNNNDCPIKVDVSGALKEPGVYCFQEGDTVIDSVKKAGGFTWNVGYKFVSRKINLASPLVNYQKLYFPFTEDLICTLQDFQPYTEEVEHLFDENNDQNESENSTDTNKEDSTSKDQNDTNTEGQNDSNSNCININTGTKDDLILLNGIGESTAQKIIDARPFETIEDILNVSGIGETTFNKFKDQICI